MRLCREHWQLCCTDISSLGQSHAKVLCSLSTRGWCRIRSEHTQSLLRKSSSHARHCTSPAGGITEGACSFRRINYRYGCARRITQGAVHPTAQNETTCAQKTFCLCSMQGSSVHSTHMGARQTRGLHRITVRHPSNGTVATQRLLQETSVALISCCCGLHIPCCCCCGGSGDCLADALVLGPCCSVAGLAAEASCLASRAFGAMAFYQLCL